VVLAHVVFEGLTVGVRRRLPAGLFGAWVEVVGQVFAVGVANLLLGMLDVDHFI
jgi:hypothetical protein